MKVNGGPLSKRGPQKNDKGKQRRSQGIRPEDSEGA